MNDRTDLAIIGGGPAGMAAAEVASKAGLSVTIIDEQQRLGGQILRQPSKHFQVNNWLPGRVYNGVKAQLARAEALPVHFLSGMSVHSAYRDTFGFDLQLAGPSGATHLPAKRLLIATGCYDMPVAFPGWTLPGITTAGAAQAFVKAQQIVPGDRFVLAGTHPLQIILAEQILKAGGRVEAVLFAQSITRSLRVLGAPVTATAHLKLLAAAGNAMVRLLRAGVPVHFGQTIGKAEGLDRVEAATIVKVINGVPGDKIGQIKCDAIATCFGFLPQCDLPRALGAKAVAIPKTGGWRIVHDEWMFTGVDDLFVAGEVTGVAGAESSMIEGRIAGLAVARSAGVMGDAEALRLVKPLRRRLASLRSFADLLSSISDPSPLWMHLASPDTILCRCEDLTRGAVTATIDAHPTVDINTIKKLTRAGMGRCQGRGCEHQIRALMGSTAPDQCFEARMPVRPTPIATIAAADEQPN
ncbi:NAD(P)/FAD-dependent oxidoreductase [Rhizobium sp. ZPR3]|uniref:NAD(P)/FAD-dependent oxidoreductase n=2 Tax=unclassified Rhizobium TaxID=2613769 RepID=A0AAU7SRJ4_9HYPH